MAPMSENYYDYKFSASSIDSANSVQLVFLTALESQNQFGSREVWTHNLLVIR